MSQWTNADLKAQFDSAVANGWMQFFEASAAQYGFDVELLLAIASRETNMRNIKGDFRGGVWHGYGIMQVDIGTNPTFCNAWTDSDVEGSIDCGTKILQGKKTYLAGKGIADVKAIAAAYNTGEGNVARSIAAGLDPDHTTTGGNYGSDVVARMGVFKGLRSSAATNAS